MKKSEKKSPLKIVIGDEFKVKIESPEEMKDSYFSDIYRRASNAIKEIQENTRLAEEKQEDSELKKIFQKEFNNLIAFIGERGTGKSSVMISFANFLAENHDNTTHPLHLSASFKGKSENLPARFHVLPPIDPTMFEDGESILRNIIASMFASFKDEAKDREYAEKEAPITAFQDVYEGLQMLAKDEKAVFEHNRESESSLDTLAALSQGVSFPPFSGQQFL